MNWMSSLLLGFFSGIGTLLPLSAQACRGLLCQILDAPPVSALFLFFCRAAILAILLSSGLLELHRLRRTARIQRMPYRRRTGHPSLNESGTLRLLRLAFFPALVGGMLGARMESAAARLWLVPLPLILGGFLLWLPTQMPSANKDARHLSGLDGLLLGLGALTAAVPGISTVGTVFSIGSMRGAQRRYALRFACLMLAVNLAGGMVMDLLSIVATGFSLGGAELMFAGIGAAAAAVGAFAATRILGALIRPGAVGLFDFCYLNWGQALLCLVLFLMV